MSTVIPKLSAISSYGKGLLAALDETPNEHQEQVKRILKGEKPKRDSVLEKLQDGSVKIGPTIAEAAAAMEARQPLWREDAYCIFIAHCSCKNCGRRWTAQLDPNIYLRSRMVRKPGTPTPELRASKPYMYVPVKSISNWNIPKLKVSTFYAPFACADCFEGIAPCPPIHTSKYSLDAIELPEDQPNGSGESSGLIPQPLLPVPILEEVGAASIPFLQLTPQERQSSSGMCLSLESSPEMFAHAHDMNSHIAELHFANLMPMSEG